MTHDARIAVIGAGVIGMAVAVRLQRDGHKVTVFDRLGPAEACSFGNSGAMPKYQVMPMSTPGILFQVPGYLMDPLGPLALKASYFPVLVPWLIRFLRAGRSVAFARNFSALAALAAAGYEAWTELLTDAEMTADVRENSSLTLYRTSSERDKSKSKWMRLRGLGADIDFVEGQRLRQFEAVLPDGYPFGVVDAHYRHALDPHALVLGLAGYFAQLGGTLCRANVAQIQARGPDCFVLNTDRAQQMFTKVVVAAGAWSNELLHPLGSKVPLEAGRGYHMTFADFGPMPERVLLISDMRMSLTPMSNGLRLGGSIEFAGLRSAPDFRRTDAQRRNLQRLFPSARLQNFTQWSGDRPMTPDSLPVIDRLPGHPNIFCAFGHGQYGLTLAAITASLVADLVANRPPVLDMAPLRCDRQF